MPRYPCFRKPTVLALNLWILMYCDARKSKSPFLKSTVTARGPGSAHRQVGSHILLDANRMNFCSWWFVQSGLSWFVQTWIPQIHPIYSSIYSIYHGFIMFFHVLSSSSLIFAIFNWPITRWLESPWLRAPAFLDFCQTFTQCAQQRAVGQRVGLLLYLKPLGDRPAIDMVILRFLKIQYMN